MSKVGEPMRARSAMTLAILASVMLGTALVSWHFINRTLKDEQRAKQDALRDALTGLPNRNALLADINQSDGSEPLAIAFTDLDGFKDVNDTFGHDLGDKLIKVVAQGLSILCKQNGLVCRMGGDEFVVLFRGKDAKSEAEAFSKNLIAFLAQPFDFDGRLAAVGVSIGIALAHGRAADATELLRCADIAMYEAKRRGKNQLCFYETALDADRIDNREISSDLASLLDSKELEAVFQPVVDASTGRIKSVEALARWPQGKTSYYTPERFVRAAELSGLIDALGHAILEKACKAAKAWGELPVAVNISPLQLKNPRFVEQALAIMERNGIAPSRIEFEITETVLVEDMAHARKLLARLRSHGIKIALDDFGSGYSSVGYIRQFQFDRIKIDRSITSKVASSPDEVAIVQGIMLIARGLTADVTAEGVEHEHEAQLLRLTGCTAFQGYFFHRPMPAQAITALLRDETTRAEAAA